MASTIDLSKLPAPDVVETLDFEAVLADMKADLIARGTAIGVDLSPVLALESEPLVLLLETAAYRETLLRSRVNMAAKAVMPAFAQGADLDQVASILDVQRLVLDPGDPDTGVAPTYESDPALLARFLLAPAGFSVAGPSDAYKFHALSADPKVLDATATSPAPCQVTVTVLSTEGDGTADADLLTAVTAAVSGESVRPLTDQVTVQSAGVVNFSVAGTRYTYAGPDPDVVTAASDASLQAYLTASRRLGRDVTLSGLYAALTVPGIQRVELDEPTATIAVNETQVANCTSTDLTFGGVDD